MERIQIPGHHKYRARDRSVLLFVSDRIGDCRSRAVKETPDLRTRHPWYLSAPSAAVGGGSRGVACGASFDAAISPPRCRDGDVFVRGAEFLRLSDRLRVAQRRG